MSTTTGRSSARATDDGWAGLFKTAFSRSQNAMALTDETRRVRDVNGPFSRLLDYPPSALKGRPISDIVYGGPLMTASEWREAIMRSGGTDEALLERADASTVAVQFAWHTETISGTRMVLFVCMAVSRWGRHFRRAGGPVDT